MNGRVAEGMTEERTEARRAPRAANPTGTVTRTKNCEHYTNPTHKRHFRTPEFFTVGSIKQSSSHLAHAQSLLFLCLTSSAHSIRTPHPTSLLFPSHGDDLCDDPRHGARLCEPSDLTEMNNTEVTPIFFQRPSVTSTCESAESIATLLNRIWTISKYGTCWLHHCACAWRPAAVFSHTRKSSLAPTETVFPWHIEQFKEKMKPFPDSLNRKMTRD